MVRYYLAFVFVFCSWTSYVMSNDLTLTYIYQRTALLSCEKPNSDSNAVWVKDGITVDTAADPNLMITGTGSLVIDKFEFADTGMYHCQDSDIDYTLIIDCPANSDPDFVSKQCICSPGATRNASNNRLECDLCPYATYKLHPGNNACFECPTSLVTEGEGSIYETSCVCPPGQGILISMCVICPADSYQDGYEDIPCVDCPRYSATPLPFGESDAEGFTHRSDCVCSYSPDNADNATCWPFNTSPDVSLLQLETTSVLISWSTVSLARGDNGAFRGIITGYHVEVNENNQLKSNAFTQNYTPSDYTPEQNYTLEISDLKPDTSYTVSVNAYTTGTENEYGPPSLLTITTSPLPTTPPATTTPTQSPHVFVSTTATTPTTPTTPTTTEAPESTTQPTMSSTEPPITTVVTTVTATVATGGTSTTPGGATIAGTPKVVVRNDNTASSFLAVLVVFLAIFIAVLLILVALRYLYTRRRRSRKRMYAQSGQGTDKMKRIGAQPHYPVYSNAVYLNSDASDSLI